MTVTILKNDIRLAQYHYKRTSNAHKHMRGLLAFYRALHSGNGARITARINEG